MSKIKTMGFLLAILVGARASDEAAPPGDAPLEPFWLKPQMQLGMTFRPTDTIISVPGKSGTTWTMNIFHQLRSGGDPDLKDVYAEVPWMEFKERPNQTDEELYERWANMPADVPRAFKTHSAPPTAHSPPFLPYREDVKYVVVYRNPEEAMVSFLPFLKGHRQELWDYWNANPIKEAFLGPADISFDEWFHQKALTFGAREGVPGPPGGLLDIFFNSFIEGWWPYRHKSNVLMLHFSDMKKDHEGSVRKIAAHLGYKPTDEQWPNILEYTSFKWMKANGEKFELPTVCPSIMTGDVVRKGGTGTMIRKGGTGAQKQDGMTDAIAAQIHDLADQLVSDPQARKWMFEGGAVPP